jgi:hypothetical protein
MINYLLFENKYTIISRLTEFNKKLQILSVILLAYILKKTKHRLYLLLFYST